MKNDNYELRVCSGIEIRSPNEDEEHLGTIIGYASVFNHKSRLLFDNRQARGKKYFYEMISANAFDKVLADPNLNCVANVHHDDRQMLARTKSGTLKLKTDSRGLQYIFDVPDTTLGKDTKEMVARGDMNESSFRFIANPSKIEWTKPDAEGVRTRIVHEVIALMDVALVVNGAYSNTDINVDVAMRQLNEIEEIEKAEFERQLRINYILTKNYE